MWAGPARTEQFFLWRMNMPAKFFALTGFTLTLALATLTPEASAIIITFDGVDGYSTTGGTASNGELRGQPSPAAATKWAGPNQVPARINVIQDSAPGENAAQTQPGIVGTNFAQYTFTPGATDLGGTLDANASVVNYSINLRFDDPDYTGAGNNDNLAIQRVRFGSENVARFELFSGGRFSYNVGGLPGSRLASTTLGGTTRFVGTEDVYFNVAGQFNYATNTYTLLVNGVPQTTADGGTNVNIPFFNAAASTADVRLFNLNSTDINWRRVSVDDLTVVIPEPTALSLGLIGAFGLLMRRR